MALIAPNSPSDYNPENLSGVDVYQHRLERVGRLDRGPLRGHQRISALARRADTLSLLARQSQAGAVGGVALSSCATAVTIWAGANGLFKSTLLGTPCEGH